MIFHLNTFGKVLSAHIGNKDLDILGEEGGTDEQIHDRDITWLLQSKVVVAEVSTPSLGIGYEIRTAVENDKPTLCLYRPQEGRRLSAMIAGCRGVTNVNYRTLDESKLIIDSFFAKLPKF